MENSWGNMTRTNCENVLMAMLAELDGEESEISAEEKSLHLAECAACRTEFEQIQKTGNLLQRQARREPETDLWSAIEKRIQPKTAPRVGWRWFLVLGALLVAFKLLEMLPAEDFGLWFKIVPLIFVVALFGFLKENPFKINTELILEK
jgi:predicted anti-sigma-YlaC factor YlaD